MADIEKRLAENHLFNFNLMTTYNREFVFSVQCSLLSRVHWYINLVMKTTYSEKNLIFYIYLSQFQFLKKAQLSNRLKQTFIAGCLLRFIYKAILVSLFVFN